MKKRIISMLLVVAMMTTMLPTSVFAAAGKGDAAPTQTTQTNQTPPPTTPVNPFEDAKESDWYYNAMMYVKENGIFSGTSSKTFSAGGTMSRGMFVTVLGRMAGVNPDEYRQAPPFTDVPANAYYAPFVVWAAKYGITTGTGDRKFSPDGFVNRQQMATHIVTYFEKFHVAYSTGTPTDTEPKDFAAVAPWAKDSVRKLWQAGLMVGTGGDFNPNGNTTRAEAAAVCMRVDERVAQWYSEPGVPAPDRTNPTEKPEEKPVKPDAGGSGDDGGSNTTYFEVKFHAPAGMTEIEMPKDKVYAENTAITSLPTPFKKNTAFLGWYYDAGFTKPVQNSDKLTKSIDLYASFAEGVTQLSAQETPNYVTTVGVATTFTFQVKADSAADLKRDLTLKNVTAVNADVAYTVTDSGAGIYTISATLSGGQTYKAELPEGSKALFVYKGEVQLASIRVFNFITTKEETLGLELAKDIAYIPSEQISNMTGSAFDGLFNASVGGAKTAAVTENTTTGTFTYGGDKIAVGDTVSIYSGTRPDKRDLTTTGTAADGDVAYVTVTSIEGTTYSYASADSKDVMFTPDVLPIPGTADTDELPNQITVAADVLDFSDDKYATAGLSSQTVVEKGDFIVLYTGEFGVAAVAVASAGDAPVYGKITGVTPPAADGTDYVITYTDATEADIMAAMDIYSSRNEEIEVTAEQARAIEADIEKQAMESGFVEESAQYLAALALETDGFRELNGDMDLKSYTLETADGQPLSEGEMALMAGGSKVEITKKKITATVAAGRVLQHFDGSTGVRVELALDFIFEITPKQGSDNKIEIALQAIFEQEVMLSVNVSGGAIWKKAWIFPYIYDYQLNANFDVGTFTGIGVTATAKTVGPNSDDGYDWKPVTGNKYEDKIINIGKQITDLMDESDEFMGKKMVDENGDEIEWSGGSNSGGLTEKYAAMIENADGSWIELFRKEIFSMESSVDPFHILVFGISADFVVSANMYITIGMTFEYANAKRYNFSLMLFHRQTSNETIDLEEEHYQFDFYVMGTLGIRAGLELEVGVGLFSLKLDSIGITAELGAYAQLWGYFYYSLTWSASAGKDSSYSGAMLIDIGIYLKITFKAQLFSSDKLTYQPTLFDKQWPLFTVGEQANVFDFDYADTDVPKFDVKTVKYFTLPTYLFDMEFMDMKTGEIGGGADADEDHPPRNFDDATESHFIIRFSNPAFTYEPEHNTVRVTPSSDTSTEEIGTMDITWKDGTLAFTSKAISREIPLKWSDPANARYYSFDTGGGDTVPMISTGVGGPVTPPTPPNKQGYTFGGWYADRALTIPFAEFPATMPELDYGNGEKGLTLYAKWDPAPNTYKVERYYQELGGRYVLAGEPEVVTTQKTEEETRPNTDAPKGFVRNIWKHLIDLPIAADGSTVVKLYFDREKYLALFNYGEFANKNDELIYQLPYEADIYQPTVNLGGYIFDGWYRNRDCTGEPVSFTETVTDTDGVEIQRQLQKMGTKDITYYAKWKPDPNTPYRVEHYAENAGARGYKLLGGASGVENKTGATGTTFNCATLAKQADGFTYTDATVNGRAATEGSIRADGTTVVKLYYDRKTYDALWQVDGVTATTTTSQHGTLITPPSNPTKPGYDFVGWQDYTAPMLMPIGGKTFTAMWKVGQARYTVQHVRQNLDGSTYPTTNAGGLLETEILSATSATYVTPPVKTYTGFTPPATELVIVKADGSTVVTYQYARNQYAVDLFPEYGTITGTPLRSYLYGVGATLPQTVTKPGYVFAGWYANDDTSKTIVTAIPKNATGAKLFTAKWTAATNTVYTVEHYTENAEDNKYSINTGLTETKRGVTGEYGTATAKAITGFTAKADNITTRKITADGEMVIKLDYTRNKYDVTWLDYNETTSLGKTTVKHGAAIQDPTGIKQPTRTGYTFTGWQNLDTMPLSHTTRNAKDHGAWRANTYPVTFDLNYTGAPAATTANQTYESNYTLSSPTRTGYVFGGWYTTAETGGTEVTNRIKITTAAAHTLYARWTAATNTAYTVKYFTENLTGSGSAEHSSEEKFGTTGATVTATAKAIPGFTAKTDNVVTGTITANGKMVITLYYTRNSYDVTWYDYADTARLATTTVKYGAAITAPTTPTPTRTGYTFARWSSLHATMPAETVRYNADTNGSWTANTYSVSFDCNGGDTAAPTPIPQTFDRSYSLPTSNPTRDGFVFDGWFTAQTGGTKVTATDTVTTAAAHTLYAHWAVGQPTEYTVKHRLQSLDDDLRFDVETTEKKTGPLGSLTKAVAAPFPGFFVPTVEQQTIGSGTVVNINYYRKGYTATWYDWNGTTYLGRSFVSFQAVVPIPTDLLAPSPRPGYTFDGWAAESTGTMPPENKSFNALDHGRWIAEKCYVKFHDNYPNGAPSSQSSTIQIFGNDYVLDPAPTYAGWQFTGWYTEQTGGTRIISGTKVTNLEDHTLYAQWTAPLQGYYEQHRIETTVSGVYEDYQKVYKADLPGAGVSAGELTINGFTVRPLDSSGYGTVGSQPITVYRNYSRNEYNLTFRASESDPGVTTRVKHGAPITPNTTLTMEGKEGMEVATWTPAVPATMPIRDVTYTADTWHGKMVTLTFDTDGGSPMEPYTARSGTPLPTPPTKLGYKFDKWEPYLYVNMPKTDLAVKAIWRGNTFKVAYDANGGTGTMPVGNYDNDREANAIYNMFTREHYTFVNWNTRADGTGTSYADRARLTPQLVEQGATVTLYAQWLGNEFTLTVHRHTIGEHYTIPVRAGTTVEVWDRIFDLSTGGWTSTPAVTFADKTASSTTFVMPTADVTVRHELKPRTCRVTFDGNGNGDTALTGMIPYPGQERLPSTTWGNRGHEFLGWSLDKGGEFTQWLNNQVFYPNELVPAFSVSDKSKLPTEMTLYAQWRLLNYPITYDGADQHGAYGNPASYTVLDLDNNGPIALKPHPEHLGRAFVGWTWEGQTTPVYNAVIPGYSTGAKNFNTNYADAVVFDFATGEAIATANGTESVLEKVKALGLPYVWYTDAEGKYEIQETDVAGTATQLKDKGKNSFYVGILMNIPEKILNWYEIDCAEDLKIINEFVPSNTHNSMFASRKFTLVNNIFVPEWTAADSIVTQTPDEPGYRFGVTIDGTDHTITFGTMSAPLFALDEDLVVKKLKIVVTDPITLSGAADLNFGVLAAGKQDNRGRDVTDSSVTATIHVTGCGANQVAVGGMFGFNGSGKIGIAWSTANVTITTDSATNTHIGGFVGMGGGGFYNSKVTPTLTGAESMGAFLGRQSGKAEIARVTKPEGCPYPDIGSVAPAAPVVPAALAEPTAPAEPALPVQPTEPGKPVEPAEPEKPAKPTEPAEPEKPAKPTEPAEPAKPTKPTEPVGPTEPVVGP